MHFSKLRLSGFKSFVDGADFRIEPGLTGVVGPNGCGKSNLLEALRWVMGAASAKAMRGEGMDDVIFAGSAARPSRNHAEVALTIDNEARDAPAGFKAMPVIEVVRRIDRGEGSTYRVNGREVRARDVQLLFADASTGANSPALVRQGQISELIAAKPSNRRRILEEAAGVSGLHGRRHEAELKVRAAQANLDRLDDLARELDSSLVRLRREARAAARYREVAAEIRGLQSAVLFARWREARTILEASKGEQRRSARVVEDASIAAARAAEQGLKAAEAIRPLREAELAAAAVVHALNIERDRLERTAEAAAAEERRLVAEIERIDADVAHEVRIGNDSATALARLEREAGQAQERVAASPERLPKLEAAAQAAEGDWAAADAGVEALAARVAAAEARAESKQIRLDEAKGRLARTLRALLQAQGERKALGGGASGELAAASEVLAAAMLRLARARTVLEEAETDRAAAMAMEIAARVRRRHAEDGLGELLAEARGLAQLTAPANRTDYPAALESIVPKRGFEAALAAALGDDLQAALDTRAAAYWSGGEASAPPWPPGARPLAPLIAAPPQLAARLLFVALVDRKDGPRLQASLVPGARLVSEHGDLWRWDGFVARSEAPRPAQVRLEQKARLGEVEAQIEDTAPKVASARAAHQKAAAALAEAEKAVEGARIDPGVAEAESLAAREVVERLEREAARREAQAQSLDETIRRFEAERDEAQRELDSLEEAAEPGAEGEDLNSALEQARTTASAARLAATAARSSVEREARDREEERRRLDSLNGEIGQWAARAQLAGERRDLLATARLRTMTTLAAARTAPADAEARRVSLLERLAQADQALAAASDVLAAAENKRAEAERAGRAADARAADARESAATFAARLEAAQERAAECAGHVLEATGLTPEALGQRIGESDAPVPSDPRAAEARLAELERAREAIGPVNLLAEGEAAELAQRVFALRNERADLAGALARLRLGISELNAEGRERLTAAFEVINGHFRTLFTTLFEGGQAELRLVEADDPLEAGLEIFACPPGKRLAVMSLMSGGEQALTAVALVFAVFLANPAPICVLDEVDAPLDDANVERFCSLLDEMRARAPTRFVTITHNPLTMSKMDRLFGVTMPEAGVSQLVSVDLRQAEALAAQ
ncbi:MAG: AAA family ATPase [Caulobacteraceae bacterium]